MINGKLQNCRYRRQVGGGAEFFRQVTLARTDIRIRTHRQTDNSKTTPPGLSIRWAQAPKINERLVLEYDTIRYDTRCYFNVRWKTDTRQLNLPHGTKKIKKWKTDKNGSIGKQSGESVESVLKRKRKATVGRICRKFGPEYSHLHAYMVAQKVVHFSTHHIFGIVQEKRNGFSPKCPRSFWEQKLRCSFYVNVKYSL